MANNPAAILPQDYAAGDKLCAAPCDFMRGVKQTSDLQSLRMPEIAFAGRSNVGKSSLLNALIGRRDMARTSKTPGRTKELNFFNLGDRLILVDMPGYGFAKVPETERRRWDKFLPEYLSGRENLCRVFLLIDARHGIMDNDIQMIDLLHQTGAAFQLIYTKIDQIAENSKHDLLRDAEFRLAAVQNAVMPALFVSSKNKNGIRDLRATIASLVRGYNREKSQ